MLICCLAIHKFHALQRERCLSSIISGVADDLSFNVDLGATIAPSVMGSNMPDLPSVGADLDVIPDMPTTSGPVDAAPPPPPSGPPPPGPPPPPEAAPPPPPPPGPAPPPPADVPQEVAAPSTGRASLLDAIVNAGGAAGAGLKSAKDRKISNKKKKQEERDQGPAAPSGGDAGGGDLMSALMGKLSMRRKGISGNAKPSGDSGGGSSSGGGGESSGGGSAMDKISSMIPAPPPPAPTGDDDDDGDDWSD